MRVSAFVLSPTKVFGTALALAVRAYQLVLSPAIHLLFGPGLGCRFTPTCSQYAKEALETKGPFKGLHLSVNRVLRCNPWTHGGHEGGYDPLPSGHQGMRLKRE